jgi:hypothetical protein
MANPNLDNSKDFLTPADKEFENNIRPAHMLNSPARHRSLRT